MSVDAVPRRTDRFNESYPGVKSLNRETQRSGDRPETTAADEEGNPHRAILKHLCHDPGEWRRGASRHLNRRQVVWNQPTLASQGCLMDAGAVKPGDRFGSVPNALVKRARTRSHPRGVPNCSLVKEPRDRAGKSAGPACHPVLTKFEQKSNSDQNSGDRTPFADRASNRRTGDRTRPLAAVNARARKKSGGDGV